MSSVPVSAVDTRDPWERHTWVVGAVWLVFLVFPLTVAVRGQQSWAGQVGVVLLFAGFAGVYIRGFVRVDDPRVPAGRLPPGVPHLLVLIALVGVVAPLAGWNTLSMLPYVVALAMFVLPLRLAGGFFALTLALMLTATLTADSLTDAWPYVVVVGSVGMATGVIRLIDERQRVHNRLLTEVALATDRERVARDVHDVLGHSLTVITLKAELAGRLLEADPGRARAEVEQIYELSRLALAEIRTTVGALRVTRLADEVAAARTVLADAGIAPDLPDDLDVVDPRHRVVLAWALREAVTNVVRHSGATRCRVELGGDRLVVTDDGRGLHGREGHGIRGLRERVEAAGGTLVLGTGAAGAGTTLAVQL
ncbi:sensor histidine kinase [Ornithinimicrobium sediminis]|uniref:sensor histidine kinase n=1 Tax=Ornithinimicrobium sediminis TaxID=2904603 RepID=UPI001E3B3F20|nr:histidine kinase [Ornithinimicrobium sediminis]MCE0486891.1 histidine kinase [Ornithinimicrobium sediminis]